MGHLVYVCTGRSKAEMPPEIWDIGFDGMIGGNGSYVEHEGQVVLHQLIPRDVAKRLVDWLQERGLEFYLGVITVSLQAGAFAKQRDQCFGPMYLEKEPIQKKS